MRIPVRRQFNRRLFAGLAAGGIAGRPCLEAATDETRSAGGLSPETARAVLAYLGYPPQSNDELQRLMPVLEQTFQAILVIRDFEIPLSLEPAFIFRAGGPGNRVRP